MGLISPGVVFISNMWIIILSFYANNGYRDFAWKPK